MSVFEQFLNPIGVSVPLTTPRVANLPSDRLGAVAWLAPFLQSRIVLQVQIGACKYFDLVIDCPQFGNVSIGHNLGTLHTRMTSMKVVGTRQIVEFGRRYSDAKSQIDSWVLEAKDGNWLSPSDIKRRYPSASVLSGNRMIFNIHGNSYRLVTAIDYETKTVLILWVGTHAEYSRLKF